jgi:hypothetical protein
VNPRAGLFASLAATLVLVAACGGEAEQTNPFALGSAETGISTPASVASTPVNNPDSSAGSSGNPDAPVTDDRDPVTPFTEVAVSALSEGPENWNDRPGVALFDFDRDGDLDIYITQRAGSPNRLYRNDGTGSFQDIADSAGVALTSSNNTGAMACDLDNDGFQDLYVSAWGDPVDQLDFRSPPDTQGNTDTLFHNNGDGTFTDVSGAAFGQARNLRAATSVSCADVDGDGWLDIYVANLGAHDFRTFNSPSHPGHFNALYMNNGDMTFTEMAHEAGIAGDQIRMLDPAGNPVLFTDPKTGEQFEGWDPTRRDKAGNQVGEPAPQTHATLFFDFDDDGDPDLFVADDGDTLKVFRNDTDAAGVRFTEVGEALGLDISGAWMGFALGDYDGDADLDVFVTNIGSHAMLRKPQDNPTGSCEYHHRFAWGTCANFLLRNDGVGQLEGLGESGIFVEVGGDVEIIESPLLAPTALDPGRIYPSLPAPSGLAAYDFGFGATFLDFDNDGDLDLYWLGSNKNSGAGPGGDVYPGVGRLMRNDGTGAFEDITVRARLLDIADVDYSVLDPSDPSFDAVRQRIATRFHENGKGLAHGDLNGDGFVDLVATNSSGNIWTGDSENLVASPGPVMVWINGGKANGEKHWIILRLKGRMAIDGTGSNADAIGARVLLTVGASATVQVREVYAGGSYLSQDSTDVEFGLGSDDLVREIRILWPSGRQQTLTDVAADRVLEVVEPAPGS